MRKTLLLNPPGFLDFDGGAGARYQNRREVWSYWYPIWLAYPAGMIEGSRLLDAQAEELSLAQCREPVEGTRSGPQPYHFGRTDEFEQSPGRAGL